MKINVAQVQNELGGKKQFNFVISANKLAIDSDTVWKDSDIQVEGSVTNSGRILEVEGNVRAVATYVCGRCLKEFSVSVLIPFAEEYQEKEQCLNEESICYEGDEIDISELIRENMILAEPLHTVCDSECRGLCNLCGADLNVNPCSCQHDVIDSRMLALKQLLDDKRV